MQIEPLHWSFYMQTSLFIEAFIFRIQLESEITNSKKLFTYEERYLKGRNKGVLGPLSDPL